VQFSPIAHALSEFARAYHRGFPLHSDDFLKDEQEPLVLEPGSAFFMPAGTWHTTAEQTEESLSMVAVVRAPSRLDLLLNLLDYYAGQAPEWRARAYDGWASTDGARAEHAELLRLSAELGERLVKLDVTQAFGAWTSHGHTTGALGEYPRSAPYERFVRLPNSSALIEPSDAPGKLRCVVLSGPPSRPHARIELALNTETRPVLDWVLGLARAFTRAETSERFPQFSPADLADLLGGLGHAGLIRPLPAPEWDPS
jgi:hypothetical protein